MKPRRLSHQLWAAVALAAALAVTATAHAQAAGAATRSPEMQQRIAQAKQRLQLTPDQEKKLRALMQEEAGKLRAIRDRYANDTSLHARGARARETRAVQDDFHAKLQGVLSNAQLDEWDKMAAEARAQARERRQQQQTP